MVGARTRSTLSSESYLVQSVLPAKTRKVTHLRGRKKGKGEGEGSTVADTPAGPSSSLSSR